MSKILCSTGALIGRPNGRNYRLLESLSKQLCCDGFEFMMYDTWLPLVKKELHDAGVVLVVLPNLSGSGINGATKRVDGKILLMVNDRRKYADTFWFTLFHEIGHIINGDYGITFKDNKNQNECDADFMLKEN